MNAVDEISVYWHELRTLSDESLQFLLYGGLVSDAVHYNAIMAELDRRNPSPWAKCVTAIQKCFSPA